MMLAKSMQKMLVIPILAVFFAVLLVNCDSGNGGSKKKSGSEARKVAPSPSPSPSPSRSPSNTDPGDDGDRGGGAQPSPSPSPSDGGPWSLGPGLDGCAAQGKVWLAVGPSGGGECGESLLKSCCTKTDLVNLFGTKYPALGSKIDEKVASGLKLYGCSTDGKESTTLHFVKAGPSLVSYETLVLKPQSSEAGSPGSSCPRETLATLGLDKVSTGTSTKTNTGTNTSTN